MRIIIVEDEPNTREGIMNIGPTIETMAANEFLDAHKNAVSVRLK